MIEALLDDPGYYPELLSWAFEKSSFWVQHKLRHDPEIKRRLGMNILQVPAKFGESADLLESLGDSVEDDDGGEVDGSDEEEADEDNGDDRVPAGWQHREIEL